MAQDTSISDFVAKLSAAAGDNLISIILYGSAAEGDFHPGYSDFNLLCALRDTSYASLKKISDTVGWWSSKRHRPPLVLNPQELKATADVFSIEFIDMKQRYRVLYGEDLLSKLEVPMHLHRAQLEYELREKLFLLRQHMLAASGDRQLWDGMLHSLSSFTTLFRHALLEVETNDQSSGGTGVLARPRKHSRDAVTELSSRLNFDSRVFVELLDIRAGKADRKQFAATDMAQRYLSAIEKVAVAVDSMQDSGTRS